MNPAIIKLAAAVVPKMMENKGSSNGSKNATQPNKPSLIDKLKSVNSGRNTDGSKKKGRANRAKRRAHRKLGL